VNLRHVPVDRIVDRHDVERPHFVALSHKVPREVQAEKACTS
jgi:hypothetical protein